MGIIRGRHYVLRLVATLVLIALLAPGMVKAVPLEPVSVPGSSGAPHLSGFRHVGVAPADLPVLATIEIPLRSVDSLYTLAARISDPISAYYRCFLSPQQVKEQFLPTATYDSVMRYIAGTGLRVEMTALDSVIVVEGTAQQVAASFHTGLDIYSNGTRSYYASGVVHMIDGAYVYVSNATSLFMRPAVSAGGRSPTNVTFTEGGFSAKALQQVYNATALYSDGFNGLGKTVGLLDFYGSPTIADDLKAFDRVNGFPDPTFDIVPVGPYDPNLGVSVNWATEVSVDVESAHSMAPGAGIRLYVANGALALSAPLAKVVEEDNVNVLSQSFGVPEWYYSLSNYFGGPAFLVENVLMADQFYALGSVEGITFLASSGDAGGSGYSSGPEGGLEYPSTSPFVTSVGGTQTYFSQDPAVPFRQVAWSNEGFVPNIVNEGGSGGGVSILEPRPWYQIQQTVPPSFPNGRLNPDLSLQAGVSPGTLIVDSGKTIQTGGTSESTPLLAGLIALMTESTRGDLGLVNPFLYDVGNNRSLYKKGYEPITSGYNIPWTASYGYNLVTGWGAPNAGELSGLISAWRTVPRLDVRGSVENPTGHAQPGYTQGQILSVAASITDLGNIVTTGSFALSVQPLEGDPLSSPMTYNPTTRNWTGSVVIGQQAGIASVAVSGTSRGASGEAIGTTFVGYLGTITVSGSQYIVSVDPWDWNSTNPLPIQAFVTDMSGNPASMTGVELKVEPYSIGTNQYITSGEATLPRTTQGVFEGDLGVDAPDGPVSLVLGGGVYAYSPAVKGIYLQNSYVFPEVAVEPGSVAPGQSLTIIASPIAPANVYFASSFETGRTVGEDVSVGSNVTATLVNPQGHAVSTANLSYQPCAQALRVCRGGAMVINGYLQVPGSASPGLYTVMLNAQYSTYTLNETLDGSFFGQILVSTGSSAPKVTVSPAMLYEGQTARISADIEYPNGTEVKHGIYTAVVYPSELEGSFARVMHTEYAASDLIQLAYNVSSGRWTGSFQVPSPHDPGALSSVSNSSLYYAGPYDAYVTGMTFDGVPTTTDLGVEQGFFVQPYVYSTGGEPLSPPQTSGIAFEGATLSRPGDLAGDIFLGTNTITGGNFMVSSSRIQGTLVVRDAKLTLSGVSGGDVTAYNSTLTVEQSSLGSLSLVGSTVSLQSSTYASVSPPLPQVVVAPPVQGRVYNGSSVQANITGSGVSMVSLYLDGSLLKSFPWNGSQYKVSMNATSMSDGIHTLRVVAQQSDGLSSSATVSFSTSSRLANIIDRLQRQLQSDEALIVSLQTGTTRYTLLVGVLAAAGLAVGCYVLVSSRRKQ